MIYRNAVALVMMLVSCRTATAFSMESTWEVLDDGVGVWRTHKLSAGEGTISGPVWTRGGAIIGLDSHDGVVTIVPSSPATSVVRVDEGALATDGRDVFVGDRDALWSWDVAAQQRRELDDSGLGPGELAIHGGRCWSTFKVAMER